MLLNVIRSIPPQAIDFIEAHEACRLVAYLDSAGIPTIGWGHTGPGIRPGLVITQEQADAYLASDINAAAAALERKVGEACIAELTDNQYAALLSFVFNLGTGDPKKPEWRIWGLLRTKRFDAAAAELSRFVYAGGHKLQDLVDRRADEQKLWARGEPGTQPGGPSSATTRAVDTPPAVNPTKPLHQSKSFIGSCVAACATATSAVAPRIKDAADGAQTAIAPYVGKSDVLQAVSSHLALVAALTAMAVPALLWLKNREAKAQ